MASMTPKVVLVVEDEPALASIYSRALEHHGYRTLTAESADRALAIVRNGSPVDLILSDIVMPGMSGRELVWHVRNLRPDISVILASGIADQTGALQMLEEMGVDFIAKPVDLPAMMDTVRNKIGPPTDERIAKG
jgi:DNA-binding NtrC family response regulator